MVAWTLTENKVFPSDYLKTDEDLTLSFVRENSDQPWVSFNSWQQVVAGVAVGGLRLPPVKVDKVPEALPPEMQGADYKWY